MADGIGYRFYLESLQPIQRITDEELGGYGFTKLKYYGVGSNADFVLDNGYCPAKTVYALNTDYIYLRPHPDRNFVPFGGDRIPSTKMPLCGSWGSQATCAPATLRCRAS